MSESGEPKRPLLSENWRRLNGPRRIAGLDLARGLAVIGMFAAHLLWIDPFDIADLSTWTDVVNGRSSILFATLAGISIALLTGGRVPVSGAARERAKAFWLRGASGRRAAGGGLDRRCLCT